MEDKFFNLEEEMVDYAEMSGFDFVSGKYVSSEKEEKHVTFKYGTFDVLDLLKSIFSRSEAATK